MSTIYEKTIQSLSVYLKISKHKVSVQRAIQKLKEQEAEVQNEVELEMNALPVLEKLVEENGKQELSSMQKVQLITHEFLLNQGFLHLATNAYSLKGYEGAYVFEVIYIHDNNVFLKRLKKENRPSKTASYGFDELPSLKTNERKRDERIMKNVLKALRVDLKRTWEHLNIDHTPSVSET